MPGRETLASQAAEKDSYASLPLNRLAENCARGALDRLAPTYHEYASTHRFLTRLASEIFLSSLKS